MFGSDDLYTALNQTAITDLLDDYEVSSTSTMSALFDGMILPQDFTGTESINYYMTTPFNAAADNEIYKYSINCRSADYHSSLTMAYTVKETINRSFGDDYYIICIVLAPIPPADNTDVYNTPIEATILKK